MSDHVGRKFACGRDSEMGSNEFSWIGLIAN